MYSHSSAETVSCYSRGFRHDTFHYQSDYVGMREQAVFGDADFVAWLRDLHDALSQFFLAEAS